jgi:glutamine amidotransferase
MDFYFAHSYAVEKINQDFVYGKTFYGHSFPSIIGRDNVIATQFHPEKSLKNGIKFIDNFCQWDGAC